MEAIRVMFNCERRARKFQGHVSTYSHVFNIHGFLLILVLQCH